MKCFVVAGFLLTSASRSPSAIAELLVWYCKGILLYMQMENNVGLVSNLFVHVSPNTLLLLLCAPAAEYLVKLEQKYYYLGIHYSPLVT